MDALPLVVTADDRLIDEVQRWSAAVGATPDLARDVASARRRWSRASAVLVGGDVAADLAAAGLRRRERVLLLAVGDDSSYRAALAMGAAEVLDPRLDEDRVVEWLGAALDGRDEGCLISVIGATGGSGVTTLAAAVALTAGRRGLRSLLLDADPLGGGLDLTVGVEADDGLRWDALDAGGGRLAADTLVEVLPARDGVRVLSWPREAPPAPAAAPSVLAAAVRGFDVVVADVARHQGAFGSDVIARSVLTVLVVPEDIRSISAARLALGRLADQTGNLVVVSVARRGGVGDAVVAEMLGRPVIARVRRDRRLPAAIDHGHGPGRSRTLRRAAGSLLDVLGLEA